MLISYKYFYVPTVREKQLGTVVIVQISLGDATTGTFRRVSVPHLPSFSPFSLPHLLCQATLDKMYVYVPVLSRLFHSIAQAQ